MVAHVFYFQLLNRFDNGRRKKVNVIIDTRKAFKCVKHCCGTCTHEKRSPAGNKRILARLNCHCRLAGFLRLGLGCGNNGTLIKRNTRFLHNKLDFVNAFGVAETLFNRALFGIETSDNLLS